MADHIRYDLLTQQALRGVVRNVLTDAAKKGQLPGDHHFYISFDTRAEGVRMSNRLRAQYPEEMTIILQHQYWDLEVHDQAFGVGLSFGGVPEKLLVPFDAIKGFFDPSVQFGLQFEEVTEGEGQQVSANTQVDKPTAKKRLPPTPAAAIAPNSVPPAVGATPAPAPAPPAAKKAEQTDKPDKPDNPDKPASGGGEVVRLDRFRKK
jgi:uncharacterized protein